MSGVKILLARVANQHYRIFTWNGYDSDYDWSLTPEGKPVDIQGDASRSVFNHFEAAVSYRIRNRLYVTGGVDLYRRRTIYDSMKIWIDESSYTHTPIIDSKQLGFHLMLTYRL